VIDPTSEKLAWVVIGPVARSEPTAVGPSSLQLQGNQFGEVKPLLGNSLIRKIAFNAANGKGDPIKKAAESC
jgi:hypothetical protein